jgi:hypothetical protein
MRAKFGRIVNFAQIPTRQKCRCPPLLGPLGSHRCRLRAPANMVWAAGVPALITLAAVTVAALALARLHFAIARAPHGGVEVASPLADCVQRVRAHAVATGIVAAVFWTWAVYNTVSKHFDLGAVSFFGVLSSSASQYSKAHAGPARLQSQRVLTASSCGFVVVNYALGIAAVQSQTQRLYFGLAAVVWLVAGVYGWRFIGQTIAVEKSSGVRTGAGLAAA